MTQDEAKAIAAVIERLTDNARQRIEQAEQSARADAVTRAEADRVRMEALTTERDQWKFAHTDLLGRLGFQAAKEAGKVLGMVDGEGLRGAAERVVKERDGLLTQVQDMRAEIDSLKREERATHDTLKPLVERVTSERDALRAKVAALQESLGSEKKQGDALWCEVHELRKLKSQTPKQHPVAVGAYVKRLTGFNTTPAGEIGRVTRVDDDDDSEVEYEVKRPNGETGVWCASNCEPCDPPTEVTHDTPEGRSVAESVVRDDRNTDPNEIKVGDVVEVVSDTECNTWLADVGSIGTVKSIETIDGSVSVRLDAVPGKKNALGGYVSLCDVRKVTT